ncbi:MAG: hypothetical protein GKS05_05240 [Nitrospirales bacterium]|nr:hypothetical protein [Nitrospirales bacterium]
MVQVPSSGGTGSVNYFHPDHLGSTSVLTDGQGVQEQDVGYVPYGDTFRNTGTADVAYKYTGKEQDPSTGLYFYEARYYDPILGRFISADTLVPEPGNPQTLNRYAYALNNPLVYTDPTGHFAAHCPSLDSSFCGGPRQPGGRFGALFADQLFDLPSFPTFSNFSPAGSLHNNSPFTFGGRGGFVSTSLPTFGGSNLGFPLPAFSSTIRETQFSLGIGGTIGTQAFPLVGFPGLFIHGEFNIGLAIDVRDLLNTRIFISGQISPMFGVGAIVSMGGHVGFGASNQLTSSGFSSSTSSGWKEEEGLV